MENDQQIEERATARVIFYLLPSEKADLVELANLLGISTSYLMAQAAQLEISRFIGERFWGYKNLRAAYRSQDPQERLRAEKALATMSEDSKWKITAEFEDLTAEQKWNVLEINTERKSLEEQ